MTLRIGALGAATVTSYALVEPAKTIDGVEVTAVAARDPRRAEAFAAMHGIEAVSGSYRELVRRPDIDAVYVALPTSLHHEWAARAIAAGKHVLCEKPFTLTAHEARDLVRRAAEAGVILAEGYHYVYHPYFQEIASAMASIGELRHIEAAHCNSLDYAPVYWDRQLGGGALMHLGGYPLHCVRALTGQEPEVERVDAAVVRGVDAALVADLRLGTGVTARIRTSMTNPRGFENWVRMEGADGAVYAANFLAPTSPLPDGRPAELTVTRGRDIVHRFRGDAPTTFCFQLEAFVCAVEGGPRLPTGGADSIAQMVATDAINAAAGLAR